MSEHESTREPHQPSDSGHENDPGYVPNDPRTGHAYDGIEEFDNPMPGWWKMGFWATIWFSVIYIPLNYSPMIDGSVHAIYEREKVANIKLQFAEIGELTADGKSVARFINKPSWLSVGQAVYKANCVQCHGPDAYGLIGPNLADEAYKHIKNLDDIVDVLANGRANGSMPAWKNRMSVNELVMVSAYVASLRGTAGGEGKAPEGRQIDPWPEPPAEKEKPVDEPEGDLATDAEVGVTEN